MKAFHSLVEWFIPPALKENSRLYVRSRMVASGTVVSWILSIPLVAILFFMFRDQPAAQLLDLVVGVGGILTWVLALHILRWTGSFSLTIHSLVGSGVAFMCVAVAYTGGIESPVIIVMTVPPAFAAIFATKRAALGWCVVTSLACIVLFLLDRYDLGATNLVPEGQMNELRAIFGVLTCFLIVGILYAYESINDQFHVLLMHDRKRLSTMAHHDDLTGLANRLLFGKRLGLAIENADQREGRVGLVYIDLDDFKPINDDHGHEAGDQVLRIASQRMSQCVRLADTVARVGGDEFAIILDGIDGRERAVAIADQIADAISAPMDVFGHELSIGASRGVCVYPEDAEDAETLVSIADRNMYDLKQQRKGDIPSVRKKISWLAGP